MKPKITAIPLTNSAAALIRDTIAQHGITKAEAAEAMKVSKAQLSDVIRQKKAVSANLALRAQFCFGLPDDLLIHLQAHATIHLPRPQNRKHHPRSPHRRPHRYPVEKDYYRAGGILPYVLAQILG